MNSRRRFLIQAPRRLARRRCRLPRRSSSRQPLRQPRLRARRRRSEQRPAPGRRCRRRPSPRRRSSAGDDDPGRARHGGRKLATAMAPLLERRVGPRKVALDPTRRAGDALESGARRRDAPARRAIASCAATRDPAPLPAERRRHRLRAGDAAVALDRAATAHLRAAHQHLPRSASSSFDPKLRCVITLTQELALAQAKKADAEIAAGKYRGPLHGIPYGVKDLLDTAGIATTYGAEPFRNRVPAADAAVVQRLQRRRRRARRQAEPRRARAQRHLVRRPDDESVAARGGRVGLERRPRRRDRGGAGRLLDRQRDRRQHRQPRRCAAASPACARRSAACRAPAR